MKMNEWGGCLYASRGQMLEAIVEDWLTAGGQQELEFGEQFDDEIAAELADAWELDEIQNGQDESHMDLNEYDVDDLAERVAVLRGRLAQG